MEKDFRRAVVMGCACVISSRLTVEELDKYRNYHPEALRITDEDGSKVFRIELDDEGGPGCIEDDRIVFSKTKVPDGHATVTLIISPEVEDKVRLFRDKFGASLLRLEELEEQLVSRLDDLNAEVQKIDGLICRP